MNACAPQVERVIAERIAPPRAAAVDAVPTSPRLQAQLLAAQEAAEAEEGGPQVGPSSAHSAHSCAVPRRGSRRAEPRRAHG